MPVIDFKIVFLAETFLLLILLYFKRDALKKRIITLFGNAKMPPFCLWGFRLLLGGLLLEKLSELYYGTPLLIRPTSFLRIDAIFQVLFHSEYRFFILIVIPLIFVVFFVLELKPRLTSTIILLYSIIGGTIYATVSGSLGKMQHKFHMTALMLLGFAFYYWFYYKSNDKRKNEWMILPILLFFIATIYGSSFFSKMAHIQEVPKWFSGEAVQSALITGHYQRVLTLGHEIGALSPIPQLAIDNRPIAALLGIGVLLTEFSSLLLLMVSNRLRLLILILFVFFNVGVGVFILPNYFSRNIIVLIYFAVWAAYNAFPNLRNLFSKK